MNITATLEFVNYRLLVFMNLVTRKTIAIESL